MRVNQEKCIGCEKCLIYCNVGAIKFDYEAKKAYVDQDVCVECWVCYRNDICPVKAFEPTELETFADQFKHVISDPIETTAETGVPGRGTEEAKTNDVTGRTKKGQVGIAIDMGRPGVGCYMYDVEKVAMAMAAAGVEFEGPETTPLAKLMTDIKTGKLNDDILNMHVLSVIIEGNCKMEEFSKVLDAAKAVEKEIDTVFSLGIVLRVDENGYSPGLDTIKEKGLEMSTKSKVNIGVGRPLVTD